MGKTLLDLANLLDKRVEEFDKKATELLVKIAELILIDLLDFTPVDTSKAVSNWQISLNTPSSDEIEAHAPGKGGSTEVQSARTAYDLGKAKLSKAKPGDIIYISNLAKYIVYLNRGTSSQAPAGFVQRAVLIGRNYLRIKKLNLLE